MQLARLITEIALFVRAQKMQLRFGELSRSPLLMLRFELRGNVAECDWMARSADQWDAGLRRDVSDLNVSKQALKDVIAVRQLLFSALPAVESASLRFFRESAQGERQLLIAGTVSRQQGSVAHISSLAMKAKLLGLRFWLQDGILEPMPVENAP